MGPWRVSNLTATAHLSRKKIYNLNEIIDVMKNIDGINTKYDPKRFCGLSVRIKKPKATVLMFESGKLVCVGASEHFIAREAFRQCAKILNDKYIKFQVHNYVVSWNVGRMLNLMKFAMNNKQTASYEPELFPGCIYTLDNCVKVTLFSSGKIFMTGIKDMKNIYELYLTIMKAINISGVQSS